MTAPKVTVYTKRNCPYCVRARRSSRRRASRTRRLAWRRTTSCARWLVERSGQMTVPQVFVGERPLGGFSDIDALEREGRLDAILRGAAA